MHAYMYTRVNVYMYTYIYRYTCTNVHIHAHTHMHTDTQWKPMGLTGINTHKQILDNRIGRAHVAYRVAKTHKFPQVADHLPQKSH